MFFKENDSTEVRRVEAIHEGRGSIQVRSFFDGKSRLGTRFHVWELEPGTSEGTHTHEEEGALEEIYYFLQGQGRMWIGDDPVAVSAGDAILVPAGVPHGFENNGTSPLRVVLFFGKPQPDQSPFLKTSPERCRDLRSQPAMRLRKLGNTGLTASEVSLGTAEIGLDYGFKGSPQYSRPSVQDSIRLIRRAVDRGINWLDTARAYGNSEDVIGQALKDVSPRPRIASKVIFENPVGDMDSASLRQWVFGSIESSLRALQVDAIDLLYIHNATEKLLRQTAIRDSLEEARAQGKIRLAGATCYGEEDALATLKDPLFQVLQVPFSLLNQTMSRRVFPEAARKGVGVFVRSVFLRGVLTPQIEFLPARLAPLREQTSRILQVLGPEVDGLAEAAVRFCLSLPEISSVLMGLKSEAELESNVSGLSRGPLPEAVMPALAGLSLSDRTLVDPIHWQDLI